MKAEEVLHRSAQGLGSGIGTPKARPYAAQLAVIDGHLDKMERLLEDMEHLLAPVLKDPPPMEQRSTSERPYSTTPLLAEIVQRSDRAEAIALRLALINDRIET